MNQGALDGLAPVRGGTRLGPLPTPAAPHVYPGMLNALNYGMDPGGAGCNAEAFIQAVQASLPPVGAIGYPKLGGVNGDYYLPGQGLYVPPGFYLFNRTADFQKLVVDSTLINNWQLVCDPGAIFLAGPGVGASPLINMTPPAGAQFSAGCNVQFGQLIGAGVAGQTGIVIRHFSNSTLRVMQIEGFSGNVTTSIGMDVNQVGATFPSGNNYIFLPLLSSNGIGFRTNGSVGAFGFQGNTVYFGDVTFNTGDGVVIDSGGVGLSSTYNRYFVGAIEHNGGFGIRDNAGASQWQVGNSNSNTSGGFTSAASLGAGRIPWIRGFFTDTTPFTMNANKHDTVNFDKDIGVSAPAPAVPATTVAVANTFDTPVDVYIKPAATTTVSAVTVNGVATGFADTVASGSNNIGPIRLLPGETIAMTYAVSTITWVWLRSR
jgi:hypothetical protein